MTPYKITDRCLPYLATANLLTLIPLIWSMWIPLSFGIYPHDGNASMWMFNIIVYGIGIGTLIACVTAWAFYKKWRYMLLLYIPYTIYQWPGIMMSLKNYTQPTTYTSFYLAGRIWTYSFTALLIATLIVCAIYITEHIIWRRKTTNEHAQPYKQMRE